MADIFRFHKPAPEPAPEEPAEPEPVRPNVIFLQLESFIDVNELNAQKVICNNITDCYKLQAKTIECAGNVASANLTCDQIIYKK